MATHSSTLAWQILWTGGAWQAAVRGVARSWTRLSDFTSTFTLMHWRRKWQATPVFLPGESQGQGSMVACHLWGSKESDTTEATQQKQQQQQHSMNTNLARSMCWCDGVERLLGASDSHQWHEGLGQITGFQLKCSLPTSILLNGAIFFSILKSFLNSWIDNQQLESFIIVTQNLSFLCLHCQAM